MAKQPTQTRIRRKEKKNVTYVLLVIIHFVFIVNIYGVLKDIYPQKIHMKNFVLIVIIIYIQMKKKYQQNIRKNNILFMKNFKKNMVKIISNMILKLNVVALVKYQIGL